MGLGCLGLGYLELGFPDHDFVGHDFVGLEDGDGDDIAGRLRACRFRAHRLGRLLRRRGRPDLLGPGDHLSPLFAAAAPASAAAPAAPPPASLAGLLGALVGGGARLGPGFVGLLFAGRLGRRLSGFGLRPGLIAPPPAPPRAAAAAAPLLAGLRSLGRFLGFSFLQLDLLELLVEEGCAHMAHRMGPFRFRRERLHPLDPEVRRNQRVVAVEEDAQAVARLDLCQGAALLIENVERDRRRHLDRDRGAAVADSLFLDRPQDVQGGGFGGADVADSAAARAHLGARLDEARTQPLTRELQQAERADMPDLDARAVVAHRLLQAALDLRVVPLLFHIDEVDDDEPGEIAQAELPGDLLGRFQIGPQRGFLDVALARRAPRVHVDGDQRLGLVDDDVAAGLELDDRVVNGVELAFHLVAVEEGDGRVLVELDPLGVAGRQRAHERLGRLVAFLAFDEDILDVTAVEVADRPLDQIGFLVDQRRRRRSQRQLADLVPQAQQVFVIAADLRLAALAPRGADDHRHPLGDLELFDDGFEALAIGGIGDLARDAAAAGRVRHEDAIAPGERQVGRECGALVAALLFRHLHQHDLPALDDLLDLVAAHGAGPPRLGDLFDLVAADGLDRFGPVGAVGLPIRPALGGVFAGPVRRSVHRMRLRLILLSRIAGPGPRERIRRSFADVAFADGFEGVGGLPRFVRRAGEPVRRRAGGGPARMAVPGLRRFRTLGLEVRCTVVERAVRF